MLLYSNLNFYLISILNCFQKSLLYFSLIFISIALKLYHASCRAVLTVIGAIQILTDDDDYNDHWRPLY